MKLFLSPLNLCLGLCFALRNEPLSGSASVLCGGSWWRSGVLLLRLYELIGHVIEKSLLGEHAQERRDKWIVVMGSPAYINLK